MPIDEATRLQRRKERWAQKRAQRELESGGQVTPAAEEVGTPAAESEPAPEPQASPPVAVEVSSPPIVEATSFAPANDLRSTQQKPAAFAEVLRTPPEMSPLSDQYAEPDHPSSGEDFAPVPPSRAPLPSAPIRPEREGWTKEPILMALLLIGLLVLLGNTFFLIRMNGVADRVNAMTKNLPAAVSAVADRPWVAIETVNTVDFTNGGSPVTTLYFINSGRTPARDFRSVTIGSLRAAKLPPPAVPSKPGPLTTTGVLLPNLLGKLVFFEKTRPLTAEEAANVRNGQYVLWLAGRLDYRDGQGNQHTTTFRYRYNPALGGFNATPDGNSVN